MKIFVATAKDIIKALLLVALLFVSFLSVISIKPSITSVFKPDKQLPIYYVDRDDNKIALTINCAWGDQDIESILETLQKHDVKASFFIVGDFAERYPDRIKQISDAGHDIGSHGYRHTRMGDLTENKISEDLDKNKQLLESLTGKKIIFYRAPYGDYNNLVVSIAKEKGYFPIQWDVDSLDWKEEISMEQIKSRVEKNIKSGSIVLFHNDTKYTALVLESIIGTLKEKGFSPVKLSEIIYYDEYIVDNDGKQVTNKEKQQNTPAAEQ